MSAALVEKIYQDVSKVVAEPATTKRLLEMGGVINNSTPQQFKAIIDAEVKNWSEAVRLSGARVD
jgi:tripartite-type tricarboxylate transporter receptor subunit TctC